MNHSSHVFNTWLLAQMLHPVLFYISFLLSGESILFPDVMCICLLGSFFSLPALLACLCLFSKLALIRGNLKARFYTWLVIITLAILSNLLLLFLLFRNNDIAAYSLQLCIPAVISAWMAAWIRYRIFIRHLVDSEMHYPENEDKEDSLFDN